MPLISHVHPRFALERRPVTFGNDEAAAALGSAQTSPPGFIPRKLSSAHRLLKRHERR